MINGKQVISCAEAREIDIIGYLAKLGINPSKIINHNYWYLSPFRIEDTPSFKVNVKLNRWYDFGEGKGGNVIDFAILYHKCSVKEFLKMLSQNSIYLTKTYPISESNKRSLDIVLSIVRIQPLNAEPLLNYLKDRCISKEIAGQYCNEVHFQVKGKAYYAIGFKNDAGGWELRNRYFKGSSKPKEVTSLLFSQPILCVLEGFVDFLSLLSTAKETNSNDFLILNSLSFLEKKRSFMESYQEVWLYLDQDTQGRSKTKLAKSWSIKYRDKSNFYVGYKDLNEWLCNQTPDKLDTFQMAP